MSTTVLTNDEVIALAGVEKTTIEGIMSGESDTYVPAANKFITQLYNKICYQRIENFEGFTNPFLEYDSFEVKYGDTVENVYFDRAIGYKYDPAMTDPFRPQANNAHVLYVKINYQMKYVTTIYKRELQKAVLNEYGFQSIIDKMLANLTIGREVDEYLAQIAFLGTPDIYANHTGAGTELSPYAIAEIDDTTAGFENITTPAELGHAIAKLIIREQHDMALPSTDNNAVGGVLTSTPTSKSLLVIRQKVLDCIDLDYLVGVYNLNKTDLLGRIIPIRDFKVVVNTITNPRTASEEITSTTAGTDMDFAILDTRGFDNHPCLNESGTITNPEALYTNHFQHKWKIFGYKQWYQAKAWKLSSDLRAYLDGVPADESEGD